MNTTPNPAPLHRSLPTCDRCNDLHVAHTGQVCTECAFSLGHTAPLAPATSVADLLAMCHAAADTYAHRAYAAATRTGTHVHLSYGQRTECGCRATNKVAITGPVTESRICRGCFGPGITS